MTCKTHHHACACREAEFRALKDQLRVAQLREKWGAKAAAEECSRWHDPLKAEISHLRAAHEAGRKEAFEEAAKVCEAEVKRYMESPGIPGHAIASRGCALRIRQLAEGGRREGA